MPVTFEVRPDGILEIRRTGELSSAQEDASLVLRDGDNRITPGMRVLVDSRKVVPADSCEVIKHLAAVARATAADLDCGALALLVSSDVGYGMARMYMALTEVKHPNTEVFRDYDEAVSWLKSQAEAPRGSMSTSEATEPGDSTGA
jgi:hypothetical protein